MRKENHVLQDGNIEGGESVNRALYDPGEWSGIERDLGKMMLLVDLLFFGRESDIYPS